MVYIKQLDQLTIDKIAAGEVIDRPSSIVKELVENAIDAGASSVTIEIEEGGIGLIRVTDNGSGILRDDVRTAFLRHATSKLQCSEDLERIGTLGFRGEALSSISAVSRLELRTKTAEDPFGTCYRIEGGVEVSLEDAAARVGSTFIIRDLFYNVPARRKFLKSATTEAGHIQDLLFRMALSHPKVQFQFLSNGKKKLATSGNGELIDVIYRIYGRDIISQLLEIKFQSSELTLSGYLGKPSLTKGNRSQQTFLVNGRYIKSSLLCKAVEDAFADYRMQHRFPFVVLNLDMGTSIVDVNVHPTKMELRFQNSQDVYGIVFNGIRHTLLDRDLIPSIQDGEKSIFSLKAKASHEKKPEIMGNVSQSLTSKREIDKTAAINNVDYITNQKLQHMTDTNTKNSPPVVKNEAYFLDRMRERVIAYHNARMHDDESNETKNDINLNDSLNDRDVVKSNTHSNRNDCISMKDEFIQPFNLNNDKINGQEEVEHKQYSLDHIFMEEDKPNYQLIGQLFRTYWLISIDETLYFVDQHAAHEKVLYERTLKQLSKRHITTQMISPPIVLNLTMKESDLLNTHRKTFEQIGFEIEEFGGDSYMVRGVPDNLLSISKKELLIEMLDELGDVLPTSHTPELILTKVAMIACKGAVKGNQSMSVQEMDTLISELLKLDQPYQCPHGRPTMISMSKQELERKFKRIV